MAQTDLQRLELEHAKENAGTLEDLQHSDALTTDQSQMGRAYVFRVMCAISGVSLGTLSAYWGFSPPAAILTYINEDIGQQFTTYENPSKLTNNRPQR
jgi:hypothetical protein